MKAGEQMLLFATMKIRDLTPAQRRKLAPLVPTTPGSLRQIAMGRRQASAQMAIAIEKAGRRMKVALPREENCAACGGCEYAKKFSKFKAAR